MHRSLLIGLLAVVASCDPTAPLPDPAAIKIGLLVPYTGDNALGTNYERAVLMALDQAGPISGHAIRVIASDTRSSTSRAIDQGLALADEGVVAIIGPEDADAGSTLYAALRDRGILLVSPNIGSGQAPPQVGASVAWVRIFPTPQTLADDVVDRLAKNGQTHVSVVAGGDSYDQAFAAEVQAQVLAKTGAAANTFTLADSGDYSEQARALALTLSDAVLLLTTPVRRRQLRHGCDGGCTRRRFSLVPAAGPAHQSLRRQHGAVEPR